MEPLRLPRRSRADLALNLGLLSIALPFVPLGPAAFAVAARERRAIEEGRADPAGLGTLATARVLGIAGSLLSFGLFVASALVLLAAWGAFRGVRELLAG